MIARVTHERPFALVVITVLLGVHALWSWSIGFHHTLSDQHGFRQTQTALSTQTVLDGPSRLLYDVPVFGPPWALPYELPLFQWFTALLAATGVPLIEAGRTMSIGFFLVCLAAVWSLLELLHSGWHAKLAIISLALSSPIYLFWSRAFLIETCALALSLWYVFFALRAVVSLQPWPPAMGAVLGCLAAMVKITTFLPLWLLVAAGLLVGAVRHRTSARSAITLGSCLLVLPLFAGYAWTELATHARNENPLVASFLTPQALSSWVFGSLADRLSPTFWSGVWNRMVPDSIGGGCLLVAVIALVPAARRHRGEAVVSAGLFVLSLLLFPQLHFAHGYYQAENALFLCGACGLVIAGALERGGARRVAAMATLLLIVGFGISRYRATYLPSAVTDNQAPLQIAQQIQRLTTPEQLIVVRGFDWSSEIPFYSQRRAIMDREFPPALLRQEVHDALPLQVGDVLFCGGERLAAMELDTAHQFAAVFERYGVSMQAASDDGQCLHYSGR